MDAADAESAEVIEAGNTGRTDRFGRKRILSVSIPKTIDKMCDIQSPWEN